MPKVEIEGLDEALKKMSPELYSEPLRGFWKLAIEAVQSASRPRAPTESGALKGSLEPGGQGSVADVDRMNPPQWARVGTDVNNKGFRYPWALEAGARYHFRGPGGDGSLGAKGPPTKGWFTGAFETAQQTIAGLVERLAQELGQRWRK